MDAGARIAELEQMLAGVAERAAAAEASREVLAATLASREERIAALERERDVLRASHERLRLELDLLKRRIFVAKAERADTAQLEMEFAAKLRELDAIAGTLGMSEPAAPKRRARPKGRRDLRRAHLPEQRVELTDPLFEQLVADGKAERIGFEESYKLGYQRGGHTRVVIARAKYRAVDARGQAQIETTPMPAELSPRLLASPSMLAHVAMEKHGVGVPLYRQEDRCARDGAPIDRGTMCRWLEDLGSTFGATVIHAMRDDALRTAFCIASDATGVLVQPVRSKERGREPCRRGHYLVQIPDRDAVFFEYMERETSATIGPMFKGFGGYVQVDAKSVFDILFRKPRDAADDDAVDDHDRVEVGCWSHARRKFWEATIAKSGVGREGLARIGRIFELDASWRDSPPSQIARLRGELLRPHVDAFFAWAEEQYESVRHERGLLRDAVGYATRQRVPLSRFLDDGRLLMDNNRSERELRRIAVGRKAWLFVGSDDHGVAAGNLFTMIASARLHDLDPEAYLRDLIRVLPHWPRERYIELAPKHWAATRSRLDQVELALEVGPVTIPPRPDPN